MTGQGAVYPLKIYGLQRTGTNLMRALLSRNFAVEYLEESATGWKHGPPRMPLESWKGRLPRFVLCVRNPYGWAVACYRFFRRVCDGDVTAPPQFLRDPSMSFDEFMVTPTYSFKTPIHRWNEMNHLWLNTLPADRTLVVRQEDMLAGQMEILRDADSGLGFQRQRPEFTPVTERIDVDASVQGVINREYYLDHVYMAEYSPSLLDRVNEIIDPNLMTRFQYEPQRWTMAERQVNGLRLVVRPCSGDAQEAREVAFNPYRFDPITHSELDIRTIVDLGAGAGAWTIFAKTLWPNSRIWAYEPSPEAFAVLRLNCRRLAGVSLPGSEIAGVLTSCGKIDLLRLGSSAVTSQFYREVIESGLIKTIRFVCGTVKAQESDSPLLEKITQTHALQIWALPSMVHFRGERTATQTQ